MDDAQFLRCQDLIALRMGYSWRQQDIGAVRRTLDERISSLRCSSSDEYLTLLNSNSAASATEWKLLFALLTNQESYFFRDQGQIETLRDFVFPELIRKNQQTRDLRVWSAGCSTGEEPYSLAMLLHQILPFRTEWRVSIMGTDLSEAALDKARKATYSPWSFRNVPSDIREKYFESKGRDYQLSPEIRSMVTFAHGNLIADTFPSTQSGLSDMDLIICRNVFIYFKRDAVARVVEKFSNTLKEGGFLITGHAEVHDVPLREYATRNFPNAVVYCKDRSATGRALLEKPAARSSYSPSTRLASTPSPVSSGPISRKSPTAPPRQVSNLEQSQAKDQESIFQTARAALRRGDSAGALKALQAVLETVPRDVMALSLAARAHADSGTHDKAAALAQSARQVDPASPLPLHVMASIADESGQYSEAKELLKKIIYLAPEYLLPYVELSAIYDRAGERDRAKTMRQAAVRILRSLPADSLAPIDPLGIEPPLPASSLLADLEGTDL